MYEKLFAKGKINGLELKNRVVLSPMYEGLGQTGGDMSQRAIEYYAAKAKGGCGLVITEYIAVCGPQLSGIAAAGQAYLFTPEHRLAVQNLAERVHEYGGKVFLQLHHPGRSTTAELNDGNQPVSCSALPPAMPPGTPPARELSVAEIKQIVECFAVAAERAFMAGIDGVEIHGAHGYLLSQFISPAKNVRSDEYGGSLENRCRIVVEIVKAVKQRVPAGYPVTVRINGVDGDDIEGEGDQFYMAKVAKYLSENGADAIHVTIGGRYCVSSPEVVSGARNYFIKHVKDAVKVPVLAPNDIKTPDEAEAMLEANVADFCVLGRQQIADPDWANKAKSGQTENIRPCLSCNHCANTTFEKNQIRCAVNPLAGREVEQRELKPGKGTVAVIGAGPGGIQAALTASQRGFKVVLLEKSSEIGGALQLANKAPNKFRIDNLIKYYKTQIDQNENIELRLNYEVTNDRICELEAMKPYAVVLAAGGKPIIPGISGVERAVTANDVLSGKVKLNGKKVVIIGGGMTGLETAELLVESGNMVVVLEMLSTLGNGVFFPNVLKITMPLTERGVEFKTDHKLETIKENTVVVNNLTNDTTFEIGCDAVVMAIGVLAENSLLQELEARFARVINIGDSAKPGKIATAVSDGYYRIKNV